LGIAWTAPTMSSRKPVRRRPSTVAATLAMSLVVVAPAFAEADMTLVDAVHRSAPSVVLVVADIAGSMTVGEQATAGLETIQLGSGFFISDDGLVVTAAHVVVPDAEELKTALVDALIRTRTACASEDACDVAIRRSEADLLAGTTSVVAHVSVSVMTQAADRLTTDPRAGLPAVILASTAPTDTDLAVLRVHGAGFPALALAPSDSAPVATPLAVLGYPSTAEDGVSADTSVAPTVTTGVISARRDGDRSAREVASDAHLVQTDAVVEHGDSGGPAIDSSGDVVGVVSYGPTATTNFLVAAGDVRLLLSSHGLHGQQGRVDALWHNGLADYDAGRFSNAAAELAACAHISAVPGACRAYEQLAQTAGKVGASSAMPPHSARPSPIGPLVLVLAGIGCIIWTLRRPRRQHVRRLRTGGTLQRPEAGAPAPMPTRWREQRLEAAGARGARDAAGRLRRPDASPRGARETADRGGICPMCGAKRSAPTCPTCGFHIEG
jgi:S1-C subfamily serine protease